MRRGLLLLPLLALLLLPTACGSEETALDLGLDPIASAASKTSDAGSARVAFETTMEGQSRTFELDGDGMFDFDESRGTLSMDASSLLPAGSADGRLELRTIGSMLYVRLPAGLSGLGLPGGKAWIGIDMEETAKAAGFGSIDFSSFQQDPTQTLRLLRASTSDVEEAGTARVRGVETTRYTAKLDLDKAIEASADELGLSEEERAQLRQAAEQLSTKAGVKVLPVETFVDDEGLLRRMRVELEQGSGAAQSSFTQTMDYYDFGVDVDVEAPPESEVLDLGELTGP